MNMKRLQRWPLAAAASILLAWAAAAPCAAVDSAERGAQVPPIAAVPAPVSGALPVVPAAGTELSLPGALTTPTSALETPGAASPASAPPASASAAENAAPQA